MTFIVIANLHHTHSYYYFVLREGMICDVRDIRVHYNNIIWLFGHNIFQKDFAFIRNET